MPRRFRVDQTFDLIQQIRLVHALAESAYEIAVPAGELDKFSILRDRFGLRLATAQPADVDLVPFITLVHETPTTAIGALARPLIFPRAIVERCRTLWPSARPYRYSFAGLLTEARRELLTRWIENRGGRAAPVLASRSGIGDFVRRQVLRWRGQDRPRQMGDVTVWSSLRGRRFPTKAWDEDYFRMMASSEYVLCPSGDHYWSYRFFEATLCGAMPIVEASSPLYEGFRYHLMTDALDGAPWSAADAEHNYQRCAERIVLPTSELNHELARLADQASVAAAAAR